MQKKPHQINKIQLGKKQLIRNKSNITTQECGCKFIFFLSVYPQPDSSPVEAKLTTTYTIKMCIWFICVLHTRCTFRFRLQDQERQYLCVLHRHEMQFGSYLLHVRESHGINGFQHQQESVSMPFTVLMVSQFR